MASLSPPEGSPGLGSGEALGAVLRSVSRMCLGAGARHRGHGAQEGESRGRVRGYLRSRHGELEPVCTSSSLSSRSAELPDTRWSAPPGGWPPGAPSSETILVAHSAQLVPLPIKAPPAPSANTHCTTGSMPAMRSATMRDSLWVTSFRAGPELHARMTCRRRAQAL